MTPEQVETIKQLAEKHGLQSNNYRQAPVLVELGHGPHSYVTSSYMQAVAFIAGFEYCRSLELCGNPPSPSYLEMIEEIS